MSVKGANGELYVGKTEASIIGYFGHKTKIRYSELSKIEYSHFRIGIGGGYLRFIDTEGKAKEFYI